MSVSYDTCNLLCTSLRLSTVASRAEVIGSELDSSTGTSLNTSDKMFSNLSRNIKIKYGRLILTDLFI